MKTSGFQMRLRYNEEPYFVDLQSTGQGDISTNVSVSNDSNWLIPSQSSSSFPNEAVYSNLDRSAQVPFDPESTLSVLPEPMLSEPVAASTSWDMGPSQQYLSDDFSSSSCAVSDHQREISSEFSQWEAMVNRWPSVIPMKVDNNECNQVIPRVCSTIAWLLRRDQSRFIPFSRRIGSECPSILIETPKSGQSGQFRLMRKCIRQRPTRALTYASVSHRIQN